MPKLIEINPITESGGNLIVIDKEIFPEGIKRVFYIYENDNTVRGGHRHKLSRHAMFCLNGSAEIYVNDGKIEQNFTLNLPTQCLILEPHEWREFKVIDKKTIILVVSTENYDKDDYIFENYKLV